MAGPIYYPPPVGLAPLDAPLTVNTELLFDVGAPTTVDRAAKLVANFANILYDQVETYSQDVGVTAVTNNISTPDADNLVGIYRPKFSPVAAYVSGILITCEYGEAALYIATDLITSNYFDPPDVNGLIPIPLIPGGWFLYLNDHPYEEADWQASDTPVPIYIGEIMAATFKPSRITAYVFLRNTEV